MAHTGGIGRQASEALRTYAALLVEHERVRRLASGGAPPGPRKPGARRGGASHVEPGPAALGELRRLALLSNLGRASRPLVEFCGGHPEGDDPMEGVAAQGYLAALASGLDLAGDAVLRARLDPPWGRGNPRAPQTAEAFDAIARRLRDLDGEIDRPGSLAAVLDRDFPPMPALGQEARGVVLDAAAFIVSFAEARVAVPEGQERDFLRALVVAHCEGRVVPFEEPGHVWRTASDNLRRRIHGETGRRLYSRLVLSARGPTGGYRLNPNVRIIGVAETGLHFLPPDALDAASSGRRRRRRWIDQAD